MSCLKLSSVLVGALLLAPRLAEAQQPPPYAPMPAPPPAGYPPPAPYPNVAPYPQAPWAGAPQPYPYAAPPPYAQPSAPREWNGGPVKKRVSTGAMAGGIVLLSLGVVLAGTGGPLYLTESSQSCTTNADCADAGTATHCNYGYCEVQ